MRGQWDEDHSPRRRRGPDRSAARPPLAIAARTRTRPGACRQLRTRRRRRGRRVQQGAIRACSELERATATILSAAAARWTASRATSLASVSSRSARSAQVLASRSARTYSGAVRRSARTSLRKAANPSLYVLSSRRSAASDSRSEAASPGVENGDSPTAICAWNSSSPSISS